VSRVESPESKVESPRVFNSATVDSRLRGSRVEESLTARPLTSRLSTLDSRLFDYTVTSGRVSFWGHRFGGGRIPGVPFHCLRGSELGGFPLPGRVEFEAHVAPLCLPTRRTFRLANLDFDSASEVVFWPHFWARIEFVCIEKPVRFLPQKQLTPLLAINLSVRSLYLVSFLPFPSFSPFPGPFALPCRRLLPALPCDNSNRLL
jgi:hypothetical protein